MYIWLFYNTLAGDRPVDASMKEHLPPKTAIWWQWLLSAASTALKWHNFTCNAAFFYTSFPSPYLFTLSCAPKCKSLRGIYKSTCQISVDSPFQPAKASSYLSNIIQLLPLFYILDLMNLPIHVLWCLVLMNITDTHTHTHSHAKHLWTPKGNCSSTLVDPKKETKSVTNTYNKEYTIHHSVTCSSLNHINVAVEYRKLLTLSFLDTDIIPLFHKYYYMQVPCALHFFHFIQPHIEQQCIVQTYMIEVNS